MAGAVRQPIDEAALGKFLEQNVPIIKTPFGFGQSNPTYQITDAAGKRYVLRKKPPGKLISKTAHKVEREYRALHALEATDVAVPKTYCLCEDDAVIGTPFYIMEFLDGRIFEDFLMPGVESAAERTALWKEAIQTLARLHAVDVHKVGLDKFGKAAGFYSRQTQTWATICISQSRAVDVETREPVGQLPHFDELVGFFRNERLQPKDRATLVHGDYKIDNLVFHKTEPRVIGILDWEMSTIGHPLSDICNFITQFYLARAPGTSASGNSAGFLPGKTPGLPQPDQILQWYAEIAGYAPGPELGWGAAFNIFKLAGVCQGIAARVAARQASSAKAREHADTRGVLAEFAALYLSGTYITAASIAIIIITITINITITNLMTEHRRRLRIPAEPDERRPLLPRLSTERADNGEHVFSCRTNPHSELPVYTNIHRIRRDIVSVVEDYLTLEQLRDVKINVTVIRPLVDKFYELGDVSIVYCLLVNRAQFLDEESRSSNRQNVNWTRATLCELIATRILRRFGEEHDSGAEGLLLLAHILVAGFEPFQHAPSHVREEAEDKAWWSSHRTLPALEVAILTESRHFLSSTTCQRVVAAIYEGRVIYTPSTSWDIIPDHYKLKPISLYDPRESPLLNQYRLIVPRTRNYLEAIQFTVLLALYASVMIMRRKGEFALLEAAFSVFAFGWCLDQFATILAHGWNVYTQNLWSFLDVTFIFLFVIYSSLRIHGLRTGLPGPTEQAFDVLALAAPVLVPRLAFNWLSDNLVFLSLRSMMADFFLLTALSAWCFFGFLLSLLWLGEGAHPILTISKWMIYIWFGLDGTGIHRSVEFHWLLGPIVMISFAFLGNTLFLTILVSMLSNTFSNISSNATAEIHFRKAVLTLEGVKADAVFAYQPPFNLVAVFLLLPLKFVVSPRWFHKIHVATVRLANLPLLLFIAVAERRLLWPTDDFEGVGSLARKWFWQKWQLSAYQYIRAVFDVPPPDDVHDDIAVDDDLTHHLIRRQYQRQESHNTIRKASRRDSMFEIPPKLRSSLAEAGEDYAEMASRLAAMEKAMERMEEMLSRLVAPQSDIDESDTLPIGDGTTLDSTFRGQEANF
ncbi:APH domain-containing protein [Trichoderma austrokoningii]